jgi:hypothetical protein
MNKEELEMLVKELIKELTKYEIVQRSETNYHGGFTTTYKIKEKNE